MKITLLGREGRRRNYATNGRIFIIEVSNVFICDGHISFKLASFGDANSLLKDLDRFSEENCDVNPFTNFTITECEGDSVEVRMRILPHVRWSITD